MRGGKIEYNSARCLFPSLRTNEWYRTSGFKEIAIVYGSTEDSYRKTSRLINRIRHQEGATPSRTLRDNTESEGIKIVNFIEYKSNKILRDNGFNEEGVYESKVEKYKVDRSIRVFADKVDKAIELSQSKLEIGSEITNNPVCYEDPVQTVNISIDDVGVKKQKESRRSDRGTDIEEIKYIHNTVVYVEKGKGKYILNGHGLRSVLKILTAFLLNNELLKYRLQFFTDGHTILNKTIVKWFSWYKDMGIILDWYHLAKKCKEQLSLGMKGREVRNKVLDEMMPFLWYGLVDKAIEYLLEIDKEVIKNKSAIENLVSYFERNKSYIPCYAVRKELGLCNSSSRGEKANDIVVSQRQKHNGMSWSKIGSVSLASITALVRNDEYKTWFEGGKIEFKLAA